MPDWDMQKARRRMDDLGALRYLFEKLKPIIENHYDDPENPQHLYEGKKEVEEYLDSISSSDSQVSEEHDLKALKLLFEKLKPIIENHYAIKEEYWRKKDRRREILRNERNWDGETGNVFYEIEKDIALLEEIERDFLYGGKEEVKKYISELRNNPPNPSDPYKDRPKRNKNATVNMGLIIISIATFQMVLNTIDDFSESRCVTVLLFAGFLCTVIAIILTLRSNPDSDSGGAKRNEKSNQSDEQRETYGSHTKAEFNSAGSATLSIEAPLGGKLLGLYILGIIIMVIAQFIEKIV